MKDSKWKHYWDKVSQIKILKRWTDDGLGELYFYDESGFSLDSNIPYRWSPINEPTPIPANRFAKRINVLGFLNTKNKDIFSKMTTEKVDTDVVVEHFNNFSKYITKPTVVILDNASIHTSKKFKAKIEEWESTGLYLLYLPPYSPELNPIEILWREMKYQKVNINALSSFDKLYAHVSDLLESFGSKWDINFV